MATTKTYKDKARFGPRPEILAPTADRACEGCGATNVKLHLYRAAGDAKGAYLCTGCHDANVALENQAGTETEVEVNGLPPGAEDKTIEEAAPAAGVPARQSRSEDVKPWRKAPFGEIRSLEDALAYGDLFVRSGILPPDVDTKEKAVVLMLAGRDLGLSAAQAVNNIYIVKQRPALKASLMVALVKQSDECEYFTDVTPEGEETKRAVFETKRRGEPSVQRAEFTLEDAKAAELLNDPKRPSWKRFPAAMLRARAASILARKVYPDVTMGYYTKDEALDREEAADYEVVESMDVRPLADAIKAAPDLATLTAIGKQIRTYEDEGRISEDDSEKLRAVYEARKAEIDAGEITVEASAEQAGAKGGPGGASDG
jgi:hypothetical protein